MTGTGRTLSLSGDGLRKAKDRIDGVAPGGAKGWRQTQRTLALLRSRFPRAFPPSGRRTPPLRVGIHLDILRELGLETTPRRLQRALAHHVATRPYKEALAAGEPRVDLLGRIEEDAKPD